MEEAMMARCLPRTTAVSACVVGLLLACPPDVSQAAGGQTAAAATAIVGGMVIDGNGGSPLSDATVLVVGNRITQVGPRASVTVPKNATVVDASGKFVTPGFTDTNVHVSL
jgi:imidazolonepropionase-like amidohydrolase